MARPLPERRKYFRLEAKHVLKAEKYSLRRIDLKRDVEAATKDISAGGVLFESRRSFDIGDTLKVEIYIPKWEKYKIGFLRPGELSRSNPLVVLAKVVRAEIIKSQSLYEIGVCFAGIDSDSQKALMKFIKRKLDS